MKMSEKDRLMKQVQMAGFAIDDVKIYLDTHPNDQNALDYFTKQQKLKKEAVEKYTSKYGPITADQVIAEQGWTWIDHPWPWEMED